MKKCLSAGAALALSLAVAACGSGSSGGGGTAQSTGSSKPFAALHWATISVRRVDPVTSFDHATESLVAPVEQGVMTFDTSGRVIPGLATSVDHPDDTTYVYHLAQGVKFSDGTPMTAEDVRFSLQRNLGRDSQSTSNFASVKSIAVQGPDTIVIKLKQPDVTFPDVPAFAGQVLEKAAAVKGGLDKLGTPSNLPIGTGPYKFASFDPQNGATLVPNPYWRGQRLTAQKVTVKFFADDSSLALALRSGDVDGDFYPQNARLFRFPGIRLVPTPGISEYVLSLNTIAPPFDDIHVRRAIAYASDRQGMLDAVVGRAGTINETLTPISLYNDVAPPSQVQAAFGTLPRYDFSIPAAKAELAKSRYPHGFSTTFDADPGSAVKIAQVLAPDLAKIGIRMRINQMSENDYLAMLYGPRDKLGLTVDWYGATSPDPSSLLSYWLAPEQAVVNGLNSANYKNPEMARLLAEQSRAADGTERLRLIAQAFALMKRDVPYVTLFTPDQVMPIASKYVFDGYSEWTADFSPWPLRVRAAS